MKKESLISCKSLMHGSSWQESADVSLICSPAGCNESHRQVVKDEGGPNARTPVAQENDYVQENVTHQKGFMSRILFLRISPK